MGELHIALNELEEMSAIKLFAILIFLVNSVYWNSASNQDDFYCQAEPLVYDICRRCNSTTEDCETSEKCQCDNIQIAGNAKDLYKLKGGSDCKTISSTTGEPWCYVSSTSPCNDKKISRLANTKNNLWHNNPIYYSYDACKPGIKETFQIGNEKLMEGVKILEDRLKSGDDDLSFYMESYEDCQEECHDRCGICGAWSFDNVEQICYLHTNDACCGQLNKRERNSEFTSGYICPWCSSTRNACPCKLRTRLLGTLGCSIAQSATDPNYLPPTVSFKTFWFDS